jgi:decaprenyl-diphosphate synthase subunit 1
VPCVYLICEVGLVQVAILADCDKSLCEAAFQYGRNLGIAFQLIDDMLDFVSTSEVLGKPAAADIKLGLATAPVLFASEMVLKLPHKYSFIDITFDVLQYPELEVMIMRQFTQKDDVDLALQLVKSVEISFK